MRACIGTPQLEKQLRLSDDEPMTEEIRQIVKEHARLAVDVDTLPVDASLYDAGMSSHAGINVMLALESHFDLELPDEMLTRSVFESIASIEAALEKLHAESRVG
jgi:acyl carrier protein